MKSVPPGLPGLFRRQSQSSLQHRHRQFLTETITAAHHASFVFTEFSPENGCVLESAGQKLMPDCRFALEDRRDRRCFEVGND